LFGSHSPPLWSPSPVLQPVLWIMREVFSLVGKPVNSGSNTTKPVNSDDGLEAAGARLLIVAARRPPVRALGTDGPARSCTCTAWWCSEQPRRPFRSFFLRVLWWKESATAWDRSGRASNRSAVLAECEASTTRPFWDVVVLY
jgi:hypothetical protein